MKRVVAASLILFALASILQGWDAPLNWTELETPAVITGPRRTPNAKKALVSCLESITRTNGHFILKFRPHNPASPRIGHPAVAGDYLDGKEFVIDRTGLILHLESTEGRPVYFVKLIGDNSICFVYEWEAIDSASGLMQIDRGELFIGPSDIKTEEANQALLPTPTAVTPPAAQVSRQP